MVLCGAKVWLNGFVPRSGYVSFRCLAFAPVGSCFYIPALPIHTLRGYTLGSLPGSLISNHRVTFSFLGVSTTDRPAAIALSPSLEHHLNTMHTPRGQSAVICANRAVSACARVPIKSHSAAVARAFFTKDALVTLGVRYSPPPKRPTMRRCKPLLGAYLMPKKVEVGLDRIWL